MSSNITRREYKAARQDGHGGTLQNICAFQSKEMQSTGNALFGENTRGKLILEAVICIYIVSMFADFKANVAFNNKPCFKSCTVVSILTKGSRNIRKSTKVVTMSLEVLPPPLRQLVTAWGCGADPPSSDSLGVRS